MCLPRSTDLFHEAPLAWSSARYTSKSACSTPTVLSVCSNSLFSSPRATAVFPARPCPTTKSLCLWNELELCTRQVALAWPSNGRDKNPEELLVLGGRLKAGCRGGYDWAASGETL